MKEYLILEEFLGYRLNRLAMTVSQQLRGVYSRKYGLTIPEFRVLVTLGQFDVMTAKAIGIHTWMHKTKVSRAVEGLSKRRWLSRQPNPDDRREEFLSLTGLGREAYSKIVPDIYAYQTRLTEELGPQATGDLLDAITKLERAVGIGPTDPKLLERFSDRELAEASHA